MARRCSQAYKGAPKGEDGFSLLEILVALALIGLAISTAMVNVNGMIRRSEAKAFQENIVLLVRDARYAAISKQKKVSIADHASVFYRTLKTNVAEYPIVVQSNVVVQKSGMCTSGQLVAEQNGKRLSFNVAPFNCQMSAVSP